MINCRGCIVLLLASFRNSFTMMSSYSHTRIVSNMLRCRYRTTASSTSDRILMVSDTIFALSSGPMVKTGVSVIRISGPKAGFCLQQLLKDQSFPKPRMAALRAFTDPRTQEELDKGICIWFPGPRSFTGEDCVELQVHGSRAVIVGIYTALEQIDDPTSGASVRPAERGEFTRRAFENGKMDLTEVEGLADLLDADTSAQRTQALKQMDGYLRVRFESWREELITCLAHTEAVIDFGDDDREDDVSDDAMWALIPKVRRLLDDMSMYLDDGRRGEILREGVRIALAGPPNAGKSSLLNALAKRPAAIVSPVAGTTRDVVEVRLDLHGISCVVCDTAGLRESSTDPIELEGMRRAREVFDMAHVKLFVGDASDRDSLLAAKTMLSSLLQPPHSSDTSNRAEDRTFISDATITSSNTRVIMIENKIDSVTNRDRSFGGSDSSVPTVSISCTTGEGLGQLEELLTRTIVGLVSGEETSGGSSKSSAAIDTPLITRARHRRHLKQCISHLGAFLEGSLPMDAAAEELRLAALEIGRVTGRVDVEELLDVIFRDFCIGK